MRRKASCNSLFMNKNVLILSSFGILRFFTIILSLGVVHMLVRLIWADHVCITLAAFSRAPGIAWGMTPIEGTKFKSCLETCSRSIFSPNPYMKSLKTQNPRSTPNEQL